MSGFSEPTGLVEVAPGIEHYSVFHERIRQRAHSYYVPSERTLIDPMPDEGILREIGGRDGVERILLTNRHHYRGSGAFVATFGCEVLCPSAGLHEFTDGPEVTGYEWGQQLTPAITAHEVGAICPDDGALHIVIGSGALALADGLIADEQGLALVPDFLMDDPALVKEQQLAAIEQLLALEFEVVLLAHGEPLRSGAREALTSFLDSPRQASFEA